MDIREKLVELLKTNACPSTFMCDPACRYYGFGDCFPYRFSDHLIAHGVTVQEWISVKDRLPEDDEIVIICTDENFIYAGELVGDTWFLDNDSWTATVTHWMPLPAPPKGE